MADDDKNVEKLKKELEKIKNVETTCIKCGSKNVDSWSRITGYLQDLEGWNRGKTQEFRDRFRYRDHFKKNV